MGVFHAHRKAMKNDAGQSQPHLKPKRWGSRGNPVIKIHYVAVPNTNNASERFARVITILLKVRTKVKRNER